jgi:hypothetical protein
VPLLKPVSCGREGEAPIIIRLPTLREEAWQVADLLASRAPGRPRLGRHGHAVPHPASATCAPARCAAPAAAGAAHRAPATSTRASDTIKVMTLHVSKGLEFPVVALVGVGQMPAEGEDEQEAARLFYVARHAPRTG